MGIGGIILILLLIIGGYILGFGSGQAYLLNKIKEVCGYDMYKSMLDKLHIDANKEGRNE